jgi:hypothetical protein
MAIVVSFDTFEELNLPSLTEDKIVYCFTQWLEAGKSAVAGLDEPEASESMFDWTISLLGNLAWAATVFFAPEMLLVEGGLVASASAATKATSLLGAAAGSGVVAKLRHLGEVADGDLRSKPGKRILHEMLSAQVPGLQKIFVGESADWVKSTLPDHLIEACRAENILTSGADNNKQLIDFYKNQRPKFDYLLRQIFWERYVFPDPDLTFDAGQYGLEAMLTDELESMIDDFNDQWKHYRNRHYFELRAARSTIYKYAVQESLAADPFLPKLKFKRVPTKLQHLGDANRDKLARLVHVAS